jgi:hypothetical protein
MNALPAPLRRLLENAVQDARDVAEAGALAALNALAVPEARAFPHLNETNKMLRVALRAQARQLGDVIPKDEAAPSLTHLVEKVAYDTWHRLLFTRFLAENQLLRHPGGASVTLIDCEELVREDLIQPQREFAVPDGRSLAVEFAARMLPAIFRADDPAGKVALPPEHRNALFKLIDDLARDVFLADDSLGWCYQFWQVRRKEAVNRSGRKIGADELPSVTQLFTEDYMVGFLLDNTLGAWHAGKTLAANPKLAENARSEEELRTTVVLPGCTWEYLRFIKDEDGKWMPAAGTFDDWPKNAKELKCLDPCMGSGHFVVAMFERLVTLRMAEEKLDEVAAVVVVIRENLFGLEIDPRCTQIGAFNVALAAWRRVGYRLLPPMNLACSGLAPNAKQDDWLRLAGDNDRLKRGMERLYKLFQKAAVLGSLINPRAGEGDLLVAAFHDIQPLLEKALAQETKDDIVHEMAVTARGVAKAAEILAGQFTLVATNVPYLGRGKQDELLQDYCDRVYPESKADLATCFLERCVEFAKSGNSIALVTPQSWLFMGTYKKMRAKILASIQWDSMARLGPRAFETISGEVVNVALLGFSRAKPDVKHTFAGLDVAEEKSPTDKAEGLKLKSCEAVLQSGQTSNPDSRISFNTHSNSERISKYASSLGGLGTGDYSHYGRNFWEFPKELEGWAFQQCTVESPMFWGGREHMISWNRDTGRVRGMTDAERVQIHNQDQSGQQAWGRKGVAVGLMQDLRPTLYTGEKYEKALAVLLPQSESLIPALWAYCCDPSFNKAVRELEHNVIVANGTLVKVPFDLTHWQKAAAEKYPHGLPKPFSSDPTQWLFNGHPKGSDQPLQVAVARLLGYGWPRQIGSTFPDSPALEPDGLEKLGADDGIVCIPPAGQEQPAENRLRGLLTAAYGSEWSAAKESELLAEAGHAGKSMEDWLRNGFAEQHAKLFGQRPFIWQLWDGRKDGFSALVNYHKLDRALLDKLIYTYLGDWITRQESGVQSGEGGSDARFTAARDLQRRLKLICEGEPPYDIFVRWKTLAQQPIGWEPDLDDGVRINIRPFVTAGVLRKDPNIHWRKDKGTDAVSAPWFKVFNGERINDHHLTLAEKRAARQLQTK